MAITRGTRSCTDPAQPDDEEEESDDESTEEEDAEAEAAEAAEIQKTLKQIAVLVKNVDTLEQVATISQLMTSAKCTKEDVRTLCACNEHADVVGFQKFWPEVIMYRLTDQISTYFLSGQSLRNSVNDLRALDELEVSVGGWVKAALDHRLDKIFNNSGIEYGKGDLESKPAGELLKAFMDGYKARLGFKKWTYNRMKVFRSKIYNVRHGYGESVPESTIGSDSPRLSLLDTPAKELEFRPRPKKVADIVSVKPEEVSQDEEESLDSSTHSEYYNATPLKRQ
ncbi:hypothetical protein LSUE1_G006061 [Lachnellula suecica]|uniref:Uncharacterized protein n=1 Tax=Lachnellula suecica TaxID=602035 RepID=A0A8T9C0F3_9HELO|nr:hypothetical protein LSUE1_G006061 [Lachnellula suecica]